MRVMFCRLGVFAHHFLASLVSQGVRLRFPSNKPHSAIWAAEKYCLPKYLTYWIVWLELNGMTMSSAKFRDPVLGTGSKMLHSRARPL